MKSARRVLVCAALALLTLPACSAADKITPSPALAEAIANGEVSYAPAAAAYVPPVGNIDSSSDTGSSSFTAPIVTSPPSTTAAPAASGQSEAETAVDSFQSKNGVTTGTGGHGSASSAIIGVCAFVGVAAVVMAVMYKRKTAATTAEDEEQPQPQQQRTTTCTFENADLSPHRDSVDGMLQEMRPTAESSDMLPVFSSNRVDAGVGIVRISSPFGAKGARISSPAQRRGNSDYNIEFNVVRDGSNVSSRLGSTAVTKSSTEADLNDGLMKRTVSFPEERHKTGSFQIPVYLQNTGTYRTRFSPVLLSFTAECGPPGCVCVRWQSHKLDFCMNRRRRGCDSLDARMDSAYGRDHDSYSPARSSGRGSDRYYRTKGSSRSRPRAKKRHSRSPSPVASRLRHQRPPPAPSRSSRHRRDKADCSPRGQRSRSRSRSRSHSPRRRGGSRSTRARASRSRSRRHSGVRSRPRRSGRDRDNYRSRGAQGGGGGGSRYNSRSHSGHTNRSHRSDRSHRPKKHHARRERKRSEEKHVEKDGSDDSSAHDDTIGSYDGKPGDYIASRCKLAMLGAEEQEAFDSPVAVICVADKIIREAGLGTFGRVLECLDKQRNIVVAIKVVRQVEKYTESAKIEAAILQDVNDKDENNESLCVRMYKWFEYKGHVCMVFERLGCSLYDYLKNHDYKPFPLHCIRAYAWQLLTALEFIHSIKLIHTDLKPENILLVDDEEERVSSSSSSSPSSTSSYGSPPNGNASQWSNGRQWKQRDRGLSEGESGRLALRPPACNAVKLIDFGGATYDDESKSSIINTRQYRSPEVILGVGWSFPSDIWSAGCIIAELYLGELLFATHDNLEHLALIERCIGKLPAQMIANASKPAAKFFRRGKLNWPEGASSEESVDHVRKMRTLEQLLAPDDAASGLLDLLQLMLILDPEDRVTAKEALNNPFFDGFSMKDIVATNGTQSQ
ncbi:Cmgc/clk protein kinase, partial [Globisporangium splendens]